MKRQQQPTRPAFRLHPLALAVRSALMAGLAWAVPAHAAPPAFGSPAWLAQRSALPNAAPQNGGGANAPSAGVPGTVVTPQQALVQAQRSIGDLARAAQAIAHAQAAQTAARQLALTQPNPSGVRDGLAPGGLQVADGVPQKPAAPQAGEDPSLWQNAALPTQTVNSGHTTVTVQQQAAKAILTWKQFNVGRDTTLHFDQRQGKQSDGSNEWIALNRVLDPGAKPSQILGEIKAEGSVYLINRNGIVFGGASQVNTHSLIASSLSFFGDDHDVAASNQQFLNKGLIDPAALGYSIVLGLGSGSTGFGQANQADFVPGGDIRIEAGARLDTGETGFSLIAAPQLQNAGTVKADRGQAILAAGLGVRLIGGATASATTQVSANPAGVLSVTLGGNVVDAHGTDATPVSRLDNTGIAQADRGNVTLVGSRVDQSGVVAVTTGLTRPGSVVITAADRSSFNDRAGLVDFGANSLTAVLPVDDGSTTTSSAAAQSAFKPGSVSVQGGAVTFERGAFLEAPGAKVAIAAVALGQGGGGNAAGDALGGAVGGRVYVDNDAVLDVSGLADVELSASASRVTIPRIGQNELANSPLQRLGFLLGQRNVVIDASLSGTRDDGLSWVGSPVLNAQGYVDLVPRRIDQLLVNGGSLNFNASEAVITRAGSLLALDGGYVNYLPGTVQGTTRLLGADGKVYDIGRARTDIDYVGIAGAHTVDHPRWNTSDTWVDPIVSGALGSYDPGFVAGGNAGKLGIRAATTLLEGSSSAHALPGRDQVAAAALPAGGVFSLAPTGSIAPGATASASVVFQDTRPDLAAIAGGRFDATTLLTTAEQLAKADTDTSKVLVWSPISTHDLKDAGFATVNVNSFASDTGFPAAGTVVVAKDTSLAVQPGGAVNVFAGQVRVEGRIDAPSGSVDLSTYTQPAVEGTTTLSGDIDIAPAARISTAGLWVNDTGLAADQRNGDAHTDGGRITLRTTLGAIKVARGSVLDLSGGGYVDATGALSEHNDVPAGRGGSLSLLNYALPPGNPGQVLGAEAPDGHTGITLQGTVHAEGFGGGGTFSARAPGIVIGSGAATGDAAVPGSLHLSADFFANQGFSAYDLSGAFGATVTAGTQLAPTMRQWLPEVATLLATPSGTALAEVLQYSVGQQDATRRAPVDFALSQLGDGTLLVDRGASITTDPGATLKLASSQVTLLGQIVDHGGKVTLAGTATPSATVVPGTRSVWLGAESLIDVSGTVLIDPLAAPRQLQDGSVVVPRGGSVQDGGSITLRHDSGYVIAEAGSRLDVSGTHTTLDLPLTQPDALGDTSAPRAVWSDAGSITLAATSGLYADASLQAHGGSAEARGGSLTLLPLPGVSNGGPAATAVMLQSHGSHLPAGLEPGAPVEPDLAQPSGKLFFSTDRLAGSGLGDLIIGRDASGQPGAYVPLLFSGDVRLELPRSIQLNASAYRGMDVGQTDPAAVSVEDHAVHLAAPYVALDGYSLGTAYLTQPAAPTGSSFSVDAQAIDIGGRFTLNNFASSRFTAAGDIRLNTEIGGFGSGDANPITGQLLTAGDLRFEAAQLYPATANRFAIVAAGATDPVTGQPAPTTITVAGNANSATSAAPLSAAGSLLFDATTIVQGGTVRAPQGQIVLGLDTTDTTTAALFDTSALVGTEHVTLGKGSRTSVSLEGRTVPYGNTVDGIDWQYDPFVAGSKASYPNLVAPPGKQVLLSGAAVALERGAVVDLSGGGDLQASEWVAGTGGSRNVLARYNADYSNPASPGSLPLYADGRKVYAILPGDQSPLAAADPSFGRSKLPNTDNTSDLPALGQQITLSGIAGLPAGTYTLLPAEYATLPGAYRVVQDTAAIDSLPSQNQVLADGTLRVAGRFTDAYTGARSARSTTFEVQSREVWQQYSEYRTTSANSFFADLAQQQGRAAPQRPIDAGQLSIGARQSLTLGATLRTQGATDGATWGADAQVDIASQDIQIVGSATTPRLDGYLQITTAELSAIGAGSLLIGGTRSASSEGVLIQPLATSVVLSNDASTALSGPEILLATRGDATGADPNAVNGLRIDAGSVIRASGTASGAAPSRYVIGQNADAATGAAGDGALLRVSNGAPVIVERRNVSGGAGQGLLEVGAGARLDGGNSLTLDASGDTRVDASATLAGKTIDATSSRVSFVPSGSPGGTDTGTLPGLVIGTGTLAQFANAEQVNLRSRSSMDFYGDLDLRFGHGLTLSAGVFEGDGGAVSLQARQLTLDNALLAPTTPLLPAPAAAGALSLRAATLQFGSAGGAGASTTSHDAAFAGFSTVTGTASSAVTDAGQSRFDFGAADVRLRAPVFVAGAGADGTLRTTGAMQLQAAGGTAPETQPLGGAFGFIGGTLSSDAQILAPSGQIRLEATGGDLNLSNGGRLDVAGVAEAFYDLERYTPGGTITLSADHGSVRVASGATLDFSGARPASGPGAASGQGGDAGSLSVRAPTQTAVLAGSLLGSAAAGAQGGAFTLDTGGAVDLDTLATTLAAGGVDRSIAVRSGTGNLTLSAGSTLKAGDVSLTADGGAGHAPSATAGKVVIDGHIDASGTQGGDITLTGRSGVDIRGELLARGSRADRRGGNVFIGTSGVGDGRLDAADGHELVAAANSGRITLGAQALIDVSGGSAGGLAGGTVSLRAPVLDSGDVAVQIAHGARIRGARDVGLEATAVWSTADAPATGAGKHFDGIVDPAGWFDGHGQRVSGIWTDRHGQHPDADGNFPDPVLGTRPIDPARDYFRPDAGAVNTAHRDFYQSTLARYVEAPGYTFESRFAGRFTDAQGRDVFHARPGIELRNPQAGVNGGDITVLSDWNLGAGAKASALTYRYSGQAPVLTLRAKNDVTLRASLSDGFYQRGNVLDVASDVSTANQQYGSLLAFSLTDAYATAPVDLTGIGGAVQTVKTARYYGLYNRYANFILAADPAYGGQAPAALYALQINGGSTPVAGTPAAPKLPRDPRRYLEYLGAYQRYFGEIYALYAASGFTTLPAFEPLAAPHAVPTPLLALATDNSASPVRSVDNPLPLQSATLMTGPSTSFRIAAGADFASSDPLAVTPLHLDAQGAAQGSVALEGHLRDTLDVVLADGFGTTITKDALLPTMLRTGTGRIGIAASGDLRLDDALAPGVIVTAGRQSAGAAFDPTVLMSTPSNTNPALPTNGVNQPVAAGDIRISAGRDLIGNQALFYPDDGSINGVAGTHYAQYWAPWTQTANTATQTGINFSGFAQGVLSTGGNIALRAGRDAIEFSASTPTTYTLDTAADGSTSRTVHGGGDLALVAGRDILSGTYFVSKGEAALSAGGRIGPAFDVGPFANAPDVSGAVSTLVALQDAHFTIAAAQGVDLAGITNPDAIANNFYGPLAGNLTPSRQPLGAGSSVTVSALAGDIRYGSLKVPDLLFAYGALSKDNVVDPFNSGGNDLSASTGPLGLPAHLSFTAASGGISIERAATLQGPAASLSLVADGSIRFYDDVNWVSGVNDSFGVGPVSGPASVAGASASVAREPVTIYSRGGDIVDGRQDAASGYFIQQVRLIADRPVRLLAGRDIVNLWLRAQNNAGRDVSRIQAGRDLYDTALIGTPGSFGGQYSGGVDIELGGPGSLVVQAGRNLGPFVSQNQAVAYGYADHLSGIKTIGNAFDPALPIQGADLMLLFGVGPGLDLKAFAAKYLDPAAPALTGVPSYAERLMAFVRLHGRVETSPAQAYRAFLALPPDIQAVLVQQVFVDILKQTGIQYNDPASPQFRKYLRGFEAINTLFPGSLGYTENSLGGGSNGAETLVHTGDLDLRGSTLQTQAGGHIAILGPGGQIVVGSTSAPPVVTDALGNVVIGPNQLGILSLKTGDIGIFTDGSTLLAQSRVFTEQGGDLLIWSSNGDINAGKGAKTTAETPTPQYLCTPDDYCRVDAAGQVTGAGIATLQTIPGAPAGDAVLVAPRGTVDAGDAGIRVAGNLVVAAQAVANADNVQVKGNSVGVPSSRVDTGALAGATSAVAAAQAQANELAGRRPAENMATLISVEVIGFGVPDEEQKKKLRQNR